MRDGYGSGRYGGRRQSSPRFLSGVCWVVQPGWGRQERTQEQTMRYHRFLQGIPADMNHVEIAFTALSLRLESALAPPHVKRDPGCGIWLEHQVQFAGAAAA